MNKLSELEIDREFREMNLRAIDEAKNGFDFFAEKDVPPNIMTLATGYMFTVACTGLGMNRKQTMNLILSIIENTDFKAENEEKKS